MKFFVGLLVGIAFADAYRFQMGSSLYDLLKTTLRMGSDLVKRLKELF